MMTVNETTAAAQAARAAGDPPLRVVHFTDSAGGKDRLWGKENVIVELMLAQRDSGLVAPELVTFTPGLLNEKMAAAGFPVRHLEERHRKFPTHALRALHGALCADRPAVVHSHEYKANLVARVARVTGTRMRRLVSTCHGWVDHTPALDVYFAVDRLSAIASDAVTVTDPSMLDKFTPLRPRELVFVQNAVPDRPVPTQSERLAARERFGFPAGATVIGSLGRLTKNKGILDVLSAARRTQGADIVWAIAGSGAVAGDVERCGLENVRYVGFQSDNEAYLAALDVYLQASYFEGLSLSLLESMRAERASISTRAGATELAIRDRVESLLVDAGNVDAIVAAAQTLHADAALRAQLARAARVRFDEAFTITRQHEAFLALYRK